MSRQNARKSPKKKKGVFGRIWSILTTVLVVAFVLLAIVLVGVRVVGLTPYAVLSGSMTPTYQVGDLVYVKRIASDELKVGDAIVFVAGEDLTLVTHRIVEIDPDNRCVYTKGDANNNVDGTPVLYENIQGVVRFSLPKLGYLSTYLSSQQGRYVCIAVLLFLVLMFFLPEIFKSDKPKESDEEQKAQCESTATPTEEKPEQRSQPEASVPAQSDSKPEEPSDPL